MAHASTKAFAAAQIAEARDVGRGYRADYRQRSVWRPLYPPIAVAIAAPPLRGQVCHELP